MKKIFLFAAAVAAFAACSSDDLAVKEQPQVKTEPAAVGFDAYLQRSTTRAGFSGSDITLTELKANHFGVFAYYTNNNEYDPQSIPNFMYNQKIEWDGANSYWFYDPIMYWPNEYGSNALSDDNDKVTFFAYAPYVEVVPSTGKIKETGDATKYGITAMSRNIANGDPLIKYLVSFDNDKKVDLLWGVCDEPQWNTVNDGTQIINSVKGLPWLNVERPQDPTALGSLTGQKVKFTFKHALAQLNVSVDTYADGTSEAPINEKSRVYIRSITFTGFATKGTLNLDNTEANKAHWLDYNGTSDLESGEEVTIYDGRKDGKEGTSGGVATNEKVLGLNPQLIQDENQIDYTASPVAFISGASYHKGVVGEPQNLFRAWDEANKKYVGIGDAKTPIYVIPTGEPVKVTIVYDVETPDPNLGVYLSDGRTPGSTIENRIEKDVNFGTIGMENGKKYTIKLHLGMNSVKLDAAVTDWEIGAPDQDIDLPSNIPSFAVSGQNYNFSVNAAAATYDVKLYGFNGGESITGTFISPYTSNADGTTENIAAQPNGTILTKVKVAANNTVKNVKTTEAAVWVSNALTTRFVKLDITQQAHALGLGVTATKDEDFVTLSSGASGIEWAIDSNKDIKSSDAIKVYRDGVQLTYDNTNPSAPVAGKFGWNASEKKIVLNSDEKLKSGEVITVTLTAGDAPTETKTVKVAL